jgi:hypothetical protein
MKKPLIIANDLCGLTPGRLWEMGVLAVLSDLDNTLAGYRANAPDEAVSAWIQELKDAGIPLFIVSNAKDKRVGAFCRPLGLPYIASAKKPGGRTLLAALEQLGVKPADAVMLGDQFFTDVLAGNRAGIQVILVPPRVKGFLFTLRRFLEKPFIRRHI